ncbi:hypothetical protein HYW82_02240 [Candidatus Peregrinibacteria bacterium]|nr:hypothetical protein [Candidatus Peregrinibacteria bacterium]
MENLQDDLLKIVNRFNNAVVLYCDEFAGMENFVNRFKDRAFNFSGEQSMMMAACGFAARGKMPIIVCSSAKIANAYAQLRDGICIPNLNVKIFAVGDGVRDAEVVGAMPNIRVMVPFGGLRAGLARHDSGYLYGNFEEFGPVYFNFSGVP